MKIDFENHETDLEVAKLGRAGRAAWAIAQETGLTISQVRTRLQKAGIRLSVYRNSLDDWFTKRILTVAYELPVERRIRQDIRNAIRVRILAREVEQRKAQKATPVAERKYYSPARSYSRKRLDRQATL